jgi:hypothetical protein
MSWRQKAMKGVENCDKPGEVVKRALIPAGAAKTEPEEKVRSPKPGYPARIPAPTRSTCRGIGKSVAGLRNCEERTATTALWVGSQLKRIAGTPRSPTHLIQDAASPIILQLISFHDHTLIILTLVMTVVGYAILTIGINKYTNRYLLEAQQIETV